MTIPATPIIAGLLREYSTERLKEVEKATLHLKLAYKYRCEAFKFFKAGKHEMGCESTVIAQAYVCLARGFQLGNVMPRSLNN